MAEMGQWQGGMMNRVDEENASHDMEPRDAHQMKARTASIIAYKSMQTGRQQTPPKAVCG